jgi:nucleoside phosphorylase
VDTNKAGAAAGVYGHAAAMDVVKIRQTIRHDGDAIASGGVPRLIVRITEAYLLII